MTELLWLPEQGAFAESKDLMEPQTAYSNPALWTVYHTIDSEVPRRARPGRWPPSGGPRCATCRSTRRRAQRNLYMLACSDWLPYMWSLNLLLLAENSHMALALWQTGMRDEAYRIFKGRCWTPCSWASAPATST